MKQICNEIMIVRNLNEDHRQNKNWKDKYLENDK